MNLYILAASAGFLIGGLTGAVVGVCAIAVLAIALDLHTAIVNA
jgi:hypothetical protein